EVEPRLVEERALRVRTGDPDHHGRRVRQNTKLLLTRTQRILRVSALGNVTQHANHSCWGTVARLLESRLQTQPALRAVFASDAVSRMYRPSRLESGVEGLFDRGNILLKHITFDQLSFAERAIFVRMPEDLVHALVFPNRKIRLHIPLEDSQ